MTQDWVIDVLTDIRRFAGRNQFAGLAEALDDVILVAASELRERAAAQAIGQAVGGHGTETGNVHRAPEGHN